MLRLSVERGPVVASVWVRSNYEPPANFLARDVVRFHRRPACEYQLSNLRIAHNTPFSQA